MLSTTFSTDLQPDALSHIIVLATGAGALLCGVLAIATLPLEPSWKLAWALLWAISGGRDLWLLESGHRRCARIRLHHDGSIQAWSRDGRCAAARLGAGSVVTAAFAWLRLELADGGRAGLLLRRRAAEHEDWRRLQVIWRHLGAGD